MEIWNRDVEISGRQKISLIPLGDFHIGSKACDMDKLRALIKWIESTPHTYILGMGDYMDCINLSDARFDMSQIPAPYREKKDFLSRLAQYQVEDAIDLLRPVKDRIIGLGIGNHELAMKKAYHYDPMYDLCGKLDAHYLGWTSITRLNIKRGRAINTIRIFAEHSNFGGRKKGGKVNRLEDRANDFEADIYLMGHSHDKLATTKTLLTVPSRGKLKLREKKRAFAICPSFFNAYMIGEITYAEVKGYSPTTTGVVRIDIEIKDDRVDYHVFE